MRLIHGEAQRGPVVSSAIALSALAVLAFAELSGADLKKIVPVLAIVVVAAVAYKALLSWRSQVTLIVLVIFFIPIKRYVLPSGLPFQLEPYRLVVGLVFLAWVSSLLVDPRVRMRKSDFDKPILLYLVCVVLSLLANPWRSAHLSTDITKTLLFFGSFFIVYYLLVSVVRHRRDLDFVVRALAGGGTAVAISSIIESRTGYNVFDHLSSVMPFLHYTGAIVLSRGGRLRVLASAQHPIALGAALMMLIPFSVYLARSTKHRRWWLSVFVLVLGSLATSSRTAITMLGTIGLVYLISRARDVKRLWPALIPALVVIHFAIPGALGTTVFAFFPKGGLVAEQQNAGDGHARLSSLGPALRNEVAKDPLFGEGFATRVVTPSPSTPVPNAPILDDQWLGILCETGVAGMASLGWLFVRFLRRMRKAARGDDSPRGWLLVGAAGATAAYAIGMLTFDAFAFIQVTFLLFITLGIGAAVLKMSPAEWDPAPETSAATSAVDSRARPVKLRPLGAGPAFGPEA
jgi:hypothetical protein